MIDYKSKLEEIESRIKNLELEKEKQKIRFESAKEKLKEYEVNSFEEVNDVIASLENKRSELKEKLDANLDKFDEILKKYEKLI